MKFEVEMEESDLSIEQDLEKLFPEKGSTIRASHL